MTTKIYRLKNDIEVLERGNPESPRVALCLNIRTEAPEEVPGMVTLITRLMLQGTNTRSAEQLAEELDNNAIDLSVDARADYIRVKFLCLNEDFEMGLEILSDILQNSTFEEFEKERGKLSGELVAELDSPKVKVSDNLFGTLYKGHPYGITNAQMLDTLPNITQDEVINRYKSIINDSRKVISVVGDIEFDKVECLLEKYLGEIPASQELVAKIGKPELTKPEYVEVIKSDANQAHIMKGWIVDSYGSEDYAPLLLLNVILMILILIC